MILGNMDFWFLNTKNKKLTIYHNLFHILFGLVFSIISLLSILNITNSFKLFDIYNNIPNTQNLNNWSLFSMNLIFILGVFHILCGLTGNLHIALYLVFTKLILASLNLFSIIRGKLNNGFIVLVFSEIFTALAVYFTL